jgi:hypothetical protein
MIGLMLVAATLMVMTAGAVVIGDHLNGRPHIDQNSPIAAAR